MDVHRSVGEFFRAAVTAALRAEEVVTTPDTEFYLVNILVEFTSNPHLSDEPLALRLAAIGAQRTEDRVRALKEVGDTTLLVTGFFGESLSGKLVNVDYYMTMGEAAYGQLAALVGASRGGAATATHRAIYDDLADRFPRFVEVLHEVRSHTSIVASTNVVRLVEEWQRTGSEWAERRLRGTGMIGADALKARKPQ